jgi:hypothetical protein
MAKCISVISWASFIGGGNRSTRRKPLTCRKSMTNIMLYRVHLAMYVDRMATSTKKLDVQHFQHNIFIVTLQNFSTIFSQILLQFLAIFIRSTYMARCTRYNIMFVMDLRQVRTSNFLVEVAVVNVYLEISVELDIFRTYGRSVDFLCLYNNYRTDIFLFIIFDIIS